VALYAKEAKYEILKSLRLPMYSVSTILFPVMFYVLFGLILNRNVQADAIPFSAYLIATYGTFGVIGASLYGNGAGIAVERGQGWMLVKRASPMPPAAYFLAKMIMSMVFGMFTVTLLLILGVTLGGVHITALQTARLLGTLLLGTIPFCSLGIAIGYFAGPNSAAAAVNMIYLPLSFASGLWFPIEILPRIMQKSAHLLPPYHLAQLALGVFGADTGESAWTHWSVLIGFTFICLGLARIGFQRDEGKMYG
ncbi:MAG: ABC transporter permease, partial [Acidobacteriales bacterium]|nr:ABC transporter permease [Terriglobales bacterium]